MRKTLGMLVVVPAFTACRVTQQGKIEKPARSTLVNYFRMSAGPEGGAEPRWISPSVRRTDGGGSIETAAQWQWDDAENAMKTWASDVATKLAAWMSGTATS